MKSKWYEVTLSFLILDEWEKATLDQWVEDPDNHPMPADLIYTVSSFREEN